MATKINLGGIEYEVINSKKIEVRGSTRTILMLRRPSGKKVYEAVVYENGKLSEVV